MHKEKPKQLTSLEFFICLGGKTEETEQNYVQKKCLNLNVFVIKIKSLIGANKSKVKK